jgi:hypothetical protein
MEKVGSVTASRWMTQSPLAAVALRWCLFGYLVLLMCPIRYWPMKQDGDGTWVFAINSAAARGLAYGRDIVFTTGPLGYLAVPQDLGRNLLTALVVQAIAWIVIIAVLRQVFFKSGIPLLNLAFFTIFMGFSAPLFWFNRIGTENLLLATALILLIWARFHRGTIWYASALVIMGIVPLIKTTAGVVAVAALAGYLVDRFLRVGAKVWRDIVLAVALCGGTTALLCFLTIPSWNAFRLFVKGSSEISSGYSVAMSMSGGRADLVGGLLMLLVAVALLLLDDGDRRPHMLFFGPCWPFHCLRAPSMAWSAPISIL